MGWIEIKAALGAIAKSAAFESAASYAWDGAKSGARYVGQMAASTWDYVAPTVKDLGKAGLELAGSEARVLAADTIKDGIKFASVNSRNMKDAYFRGGNRISDSLNPNNMSGIMMGGAQKKGRQTLKRVAPPGILLDKRNMKKRKLASNFNPAEIAMAKEGAFPKRNWEMDEES